MEKKATYTVISPPHPSRRLWLAWVAAGVSVVALVVACVTAAVVNEQSTRVNHLEERLMEMESHLEDILRLTIANHEYDNLDYDGEDGDYVYYDNQDDDEITVRRVLRRKRQTNSIDNELPDSSAVPIYDQAYGVNLKTQRAPKGLRLYDSLLDTNEEDDDQAGEETVPETTDSPIKPHHRDGLRDPSGSFVWPLRQTLVRKIDSANGQENELAENLFPNVSPPSLRRSRLTERRSRTKATSRHDGFTSPNSVVPQANGLLEAPKVVPQDGSRKIHAFSRPPPSSVYGKKRRKIRNKQTRKWRRRPTITLAHFTASTANSTRLSLPTTGEHLDWTAAPWMEKLGLNTKYSVDEGTVTVREAGLYYIYAQILHESGRAGGGFQILVDDIPILECQAPALRPAPSCHTGGVSYLPRNAEVRVRDLDNYLRTVHVGRNTFFGMVKLMDAPSTAEELVLA
ncbi:protein eiger-like isoform X6 [Eriocheir sinensis]|uniref:protein eiger-like isoform X6 n=1 Tax=Eriocheir sinensis TaxID=95602 RepID=UPI0021C82C44|nr:protein eiger-like isoform X6 [Eriocheir sinensis]